MRKATELVVLFVVGGLAYCLLEIAWRGRTHWTMFVLSGLLFLLIGGINESFPWEMPLFLQGVYGAVMVTVAEFFAGLVLNVWLKLDVWDYSDMPFNLLGQICLPFSLLWVLLSTAAVVLDDYLRHWLFGEEKPHYHLFCWE